MAIYKVVRYLVAQTKVEADSPEDALTIEENLEIKGELECTGEQVKDFTWWLSDAMGREVLDENGESVLEDW
jgi:hypothetical protein